MEREEERRREVPEDALASYVEALRVSPLSARLPEEYQGPLPEALRTLGRDIQEAFRLSMSLSNGELRQDVPGRNILAGPLKDLQASLRHLTWQAKQVEKGDYQQRTMFLGEFSQAFNNMVSALDRSREMVRGQIERQVRYYEAIDETHREWRGLIHDVKNHMLCIDHLLDEGDVAGARDYIAKVREKAEWGSREIVHTGNRVLDALLMEKLQIAQGIGIQVERELAIGRELKLDDMDCCTLFGNALDNALEGCWRMESGQRRLIVRLKLTGNMLHADIENTSPPPERDGLYFKTSKADQKHHGTGMQNIAKVVEAYDGVWTAGFDHNWFRLRVLLCGV